MQKKRILICLVSLALFIAVYTLFRYANNYGAHLNNYNLSRPNSIHALPSFLFEVSGISYIGDNRIAAEQDESGTIYIYDLLKKGVVDTLSYNEAGDYEDIAYVGEGRYYLLKSDGTLIEYNSSTKDVYRYTLSTGAKNNEGLAYDFLANSLLITTKSKAGKGKSFKDERYIYSFDLQLKTLKDEPFFVINIKDVHAYFNGGTSDIKFRPSAIAIHPITHNIYIISAVDQVLAVFDRSGKITEAIKLNEKLFYKPEGMAFADTSNLLIANEGGDNTEPKLVEFCTVNSQG